MIFPIYYNLFSLLRKNDASIRHHFSVTNVSAAHLAARDFYHFIKLLLSLERCRRKFPLQDHQLEFVKKQWLQ